MFPTPGTVAVWIVVSPAASEPPQPAPTVRMVATSPALRTPPPIYWEILTELALPSLWKRCEVFMLLLYPL